MLSKRLNKIIQLTKPEILLADIGSDHGLVPASLLKSGKIPFAIISDINEKPLKKAENLLKENHLENKADLRLGNGLEILNKSEVDQVVIAGMGGDLIAQILNKDLEKSHSFNHYILQPMTRDEKLRIFLVNNDFKIEKEIIIKEETTKKDRFFKLFIVSNGNNPIYSSEELVYGKKEIVENNKDYTDYLKYELNQLTERLKQMEPSENKATLKRREEFKRRFNFLSQIYESLENNTTA